MLVSLTLSTLLLPIAAAAAFALLCRASLPRALFVFTLVACIPNIVFLRIAGNNIVDGLRAVEWLGTVLIGMWWLDARWRRGVVRAPAVYGSLGMMLAVALLSLFLNQWDEAPHIAHENVKVSVSLGQVLLLAWPVGFLAVSQSVVRSRLWVERLHACILVLGLPMAFFPMAVTYDRMPWLLWSVPFCLAAAPMAMAELCEPRPLVRRVFLLVVAALPIVVGLAIGKAYWYILGLVALATILLLRFRRQTMVLAPFGAVVYVSASYVLTGRPFPFVQEAVALEFAQQSLGGRTGRVQLVNDAIRVWRDYPLFGVGPGNMWPHLHVFSALDTPHNQVFGLLVELGVLGVAAYAVFVMAAFVAGFKVWQSCRHRFDRTFALGWLGLFAGLVAGGVTGDVLLPSIRNGGLMTFCQAYLPWILMGVTFALPRIEADERSATAC